MYLISIVNFVADQSKLIYHVEIKISKIISRNEAAYIMLIVCIMYTIKVLYALKTS